MYTYLKGCGNIFREVRDLHRQVLAIRFIFPKVFEMVDFDNFCRLFKKKRKCLRRNGRWVNLTIRKVRIAISAHIISPPPHQMIPYIWWVTSFLNFTIFRKTRLRFVIGKVWFIRSWIDRWNAHSTFRRKKLLLISEARILFNWIRKALDQQSSTVWRGYRFIWEVFFELSFF